MIKRLLIILFLVPTIFYSQNLSLLDEEKPKLSGFSTNDNLDAKFKSVTGITFDNELEKWSIQLEQTAHDFVEGKANISPTQGYCLNCHLSGFCRIQ